MTEFSLEEQEQQQAREREHWSRGVRFLGKGANSVVRPGVVLLPPREEFNHYLRRAALFVYGMGLDEQDEDVIRAVVLDNPTPFTMGEMSPGGVVGALAHNLLWRGGNRGPDAAMLLHSCETRDETSCARSIGASGIFEGGLQEAMDRCNEGLSENGDYKFFFNYCEFSPTELEGMLKEVGEDGDAWMSVEVPPQIVLSDLWNKGECWSFLRNTVKQRFAEEEETHKP